MAQERLFFYFGKLQVASNANITVINVNNVPLYVVPLIHLRMLFKAIFACMFYYEPESRFCFTDCSLIKVSNA